MEVGLIKTLGRNYLCNCRKCRRLHIFNERTAKGRGMFYVCRGCDTLNAIGERDLKLNV